MVPQPWKQNPHPHTASVPSLPRTVRILEREEEEGKGEIVLLMGSLYQKATKGSPWTRQIRNRPENMKDGHRTLGLACHRAIHFIFILKSEKGQVWSVSHLYI